MVALITGAGGLVGSANVRFLENKFDKIVGIENNSRASFFGNKASIEPTLILLQKEVKNFQNYSVDIRNYGDIEQIFQKYKSKISLIIHTAGQPSHDWSKNVMVDFNANGTLNVLELTKRDTTYLSLIPFTTVLMNPCRLTIHCIHSSEFPRQRQTYLLKNL
jgi:CDP-paratose 2-epimerase